MIAATAALTLLAIVLSGCTQASPDSGFVSHTDLNDLYAEEVTVFPWELPPGDAFPSTVPFPDNGGLWETSNARAAAYFYWQCAWVGQFFSTRQADPETAVVALNHLQVAADDAEYLKPFISDPEQGWIKVLEEADLGDTTELKAYFDVSCAT